MCCVLCFFFVPYAHLQYGVTALHQAVRGDHATCVAVLLKYGADVFAKNVQGQSALEEAIDDELSAAETVRL
jgi:ankyrin repeat protein